MSGAPPRTAPPSRLAMKIQWSPASSVWVTTHSAYATEASRRTGTPFTTIEGTHGIPRNLSSSFDANRVAVSSLPCLRKLRTNSRRRWIDESVRDVVSIEMSTRGGSVERPTNVCVSRPFGAPAGSSVVTTTTPVGNEPEIWRNRSRETGTGGRSLAGPGATCPIATIPATLAAPQVRVLSFDPVLARRAEDVEVVGVFERRRRVRLVRRDDEDLSRAHLVDLVAVGAEHQTQRAVDDEGDLLGDVDVARDGRSFLYEHLRDHRALAVKEAALDPGHELLARVVLPPLFLASQRWFLLVENAEGTSTVGRRPGVS